MPGVHSRNTRLYREDDTTPGQYNIVALVTSVDGPDGAAKVIPTTTLQSTTVENILGLPNNGQFTFSLNHDFGDTEIVNIETDRQTQKTKNWRTGYPSAADPATIVVERTFSGQVVSFPVSAPEDDKLTSALTILINGVITDAPPA